MGLSNCKKERRKIRNGPEANPGQGQQTDTGKAVRIRRERRRKGASRKANPKVQNLIMMGLLKETGIGTMFKMRKKNPLNKFITPMRTP